MIYINAYLVILNVHLYDTVNATRNQKSAVHCNNPY